METDAIFSLSGILIVLTTYAVLIALHGRSESVKLFQKTGAGQNYFVNYVPAALWPVLYMITPGAGLILLLSWLYHSTNSIWYIPAVGSIIAGCAMLLPYVYSKGKQVPWNTLPTWLRTFSSGAWHIALSLFLITTMVYTYGKTDLLTFAFLSLASLVIMARLLLKKLPALQEPSIDVAEMARVQSVVKPLTLFTNLWTIVRLTIFVATAAWLLWVFVEAAAF